MKRGISTRSYYLAYGIYYYYQVITIVCISIIKVMGNLILIVIATIIGMIQVDFVMGVILCNLIVLALHILTPIATINTDCSDQ